MPRPKKTAIHESQPIIQIKNLQLDCERLNNSNDFLIILNKPPLNLSVCQSPAAFYKKVPSIRPQHSPISVLSKLRLFSFPSMGTEL
jgi:hypothetical protein